MQAVAGTTFETSLVDPAGGVSFLGARIEVPVTRAIVSYWRAATLNNGLWSVSIEAPLEPGHYNFVWRTGDPEPPDFEVFLPLIAVASADVALYDLPEIDFDQITPTVEDVAKLEQTRTIAGGSTPLPEFTDETNPTADTVQDLILQAVPLVVAELPARFDPSYYESVRYAVALYTANLIESSVFGDEEDEGQGTTWRTLYNTAMLNMKRRMDEDMARYRRPGRLEAWRPTPERI